MKHYDDFLLILSEQLPLPKNTVSAGSDGFASADFTTAAVKIEASIKKLKIDYALLPAEVFELKRMALERFDEYRKAWNNSEAAK